MTLYFDTPGNYISEIIPLIKNCLAKEKISHIVVATTQGNTAEKIAKAFPDFPIVAVTHQAGFREPGEMEISHTMINSLKQQHVTVVTATHALAGVDRAIRKKHGTWQISELIAETLRIFGQGTKVCAEITLMAADAGKIGTEHVIAIGGTGHGADTAWIIKPAHTHTFFDLEMQELICKPKKK